MKTILGVLLAFAISAGSLYTGKQLGYSEMSRDVVESSFAFGHSELTKGNSEGARQHFLYVLFVDPTHYPARLSLADILSRSGDTEKATEQLRIAIEQMESLGGIDQEISYDLLRAKEELNRLTSSTSSGAAEK